MLLFEFYLFSEEQKNDTQGLTLSLSNEGGRYIASEKHVSSSFSSSVLIEQTRGNSQLWTRVPSALPVDDLLDILNDHLFMSCMWLYGGE